jgi:predicted nucleic-acid-binding protein
MTSVDTNVIVRLLTGDDIEQAASTKSLVSAEPIWIAKTVLLEGGWVLRSVYGFNEHAVHDAFGKLLGLKNVRAEDEAAVAAALALMTHGIELADALHLSSSPPAPHLSRSIGRSFVARSMPAYFDISDLPAS